MSERYTREVIKLPSHEKKQWDKLLDGLSSNGGEDFYEIGHKQSNFDLASTQHSKRSLENLQAQSLQSANHETLDRPHPRVVKSEAISSSCKQRNHAGNRTADDRLSTNTDKRNTVDQNEEVAKEAWTIKELLPSNQQNPSTEKKHQSLLNKEAVRKLRYKIGSVDERIEKEKIPYKRDIPFRVKQVLLARLKKLAQDRGEVEERDKN